MHTIAWNSKDHTSQLVPFFAKGAGAELLKSDANGSDLLTVNWHQLWRTATYLEQEKDTKEPSPLCPCDVFGTREGHKRTVPFVSVHGRKTRLFYADEKCNGCGKCASVCPENAIQIQNNKPVWAKKQCTHCTACINRCPQEAIQYGKKTLKWRRFENPILK